MAVKEQKLAVFAHLDQEWVPCGQLTLIEEGARVQGSQFAYGLRYMERSHALEVDPVSLSLSDKQAVRGKTLFPSGDQVLFGGIRDATPDAWGRRVIEAKLKVPANSLPESTYLVHAGSERVGALDVRLAITDPPRLGYNQWENLQYLMEAADRIDSGQAVPAHLEELFLDGTALGGARPKATVRDPAGILCLAKFSSQKDTFDIPSVEAATLRLAAQAGLNVPPVSCMQIGQRTVMLIRRFDRYWAAAGMDALPPLQQDLMQTAPAKGLLEKRLAFVSGLTLLACDEMESRTKAYADLARAIRRYCHPSVIRQNTRELFARMVYNILVNNDDDHLRNHGFVWDPRMGGWRLSLLYDVMPRPSHAFERQLHLGVGEQGRAATLDNAMSAHAHFTLSRSDALEVIATVWGTVREWRVYFEQYGVTLAEIDKVSTAFRHLDAVASPQLRKQL